jgi:hypothetical protein
MMPIMLLRMPFAIIACAITFFVDAPIARADDFQVYLPAMVHKLKSSADTAVPKITF